MEARDLQQLHSFHHHDKAMCWDDSVSLLLGLSFSWSVVPCTT